MKLKKNISACMIAAALSMMTVVSAFAAPLAEENDSYVWTKVNNEWTCVDESGHAVKGWAVHDGETYYLDKNGVMKTGWYKYDGDWYYLDEKTGILAKDTTVDGDYAVDSEGKMIKIKNR